MIKPETHGSDATVRNLAEMLPAGTTIADLAEILFCSSLQPSQPVDGDAVQAAVSQSLRTHEGNVRSCAEKLAECYGKEPDVACTRMRWCRDLALRFFGSAPAFG